MAYLTEWKSGTWRRKVAVGRRCDVCGRTVRGRAVGWWRLNVFRSKGDRRQRLRGLRRLHVCSSRCLVRRLAGARAGTRIGLQFHGAAKLAIRGLVKRGEL